MSGTFGIIEILQANKLFYFDVKLFSIINSLVTIFHFVMSFSKIQIKLLLIANKDASHSTNFKIFLGHLDHG